MPPKKAASLAPKLVPTKESFFTPTKRPLVQEKLKQNLLMAPVKQGGWTRPKRYLYDESTGLAYAEVVGGTAFCTDTGAELFSFGDGGEDYGSNQPAVFRKLFDFKPPDGERHPDERYVDVQGLVKAGILSEADVASHKAFADEELGSMMERLACHVKEMERMCSIDQGEN